MAIEISIISRGYAQSCQKTIPLTGEAADRKSNFLNGKYRGSSGGLGAKAKWELDCTTHKGNVLSGKNFTGGIVLKEVVRRSGVQYLIFLVMFAADRRVK